MVASQFIKIIMRCIKVFRYSFSETIRGGALGFSLGGYVLPGTPNWHPVLKISPKMDTPF